MRCVLHVGGPRTGTTTIQAFLRRNRKRLARKGILIPPSKRPKVDEAVILAYQAYDPTRRFFEHWEIFGQDDLETRQRQAAAILRGWLRTEDVATVVLSHEGIMRRERGGLERLRDVIAEACDEIDVVVALRRQDRLTNF